MKAIFIALLISSPLAHAFFDDDTVPYSSVGKGTDGMKVIRDLPANLPLRKLGVKKGDIILKVNDISIGDRNTAFQAYSMKNPRTVTVLRNNKEIVLESKQ